MSYDVPDLDIQIWCPVCDAPVDHDGRSWWCICCGATWDAAGLNGEQHAKAPSLGGTR